MGRDQYQENRPRYKSDIKLDLTKYDMSISSGINWLKTVSRAFCSHVNENKWKFLYTTSKKLEM